METQFYPAGRWGAFADPIKALTDAGFSLEFANQKVNARNPRRNFFQLRAASVYSWSELGRECGIDGLPAPILAFQIEERRRT